MGQEILETSRIGALRWYVARQVNDVWLDESLCPQFSSLRAAKAHIKECAELNRIGQIKAY